MKTPDVEVDGFGVSLQTARAEDDQVPCTYFTQVIHKSGVKLVWKVAGTGFWHLRYGLRHAPHSFPDDALDTALWQYVRSLGDDDGGSFGAFKVPMKLEASVKKRANKTRNAAEVEVLRDSLKSAWMEELLEDGPNWIFARRDRDVYRVAFSRRYDSGFRFECTIVHWLSHQPYPENH